MIDKSFINFLSIMLNPIALAMFFGTVLYFDFPVDDGFPVAYIIFFVLLFVGTLVANIYFIGED